MSLCLKEDFTQEPWLSPSPPTKASWPPPCCCSPTASPPCVCNRSILSFCGSFSHPPSLAPCAARVCLISLPVHPIARSARPTPLARRGGARLHLPPLPQSPARREERRGKKQNGLNRFQTNQTAAKRDITNPLWMKGPLSCCSDFGSFSARTKCSMSTRFDLHSLKSMWPYYVENI